MIARLRFLASASLIALILLCLAWEGWLAPLKPQGSLLILKALPLLLPLFGILRGKRYTYQWACMFILLYFTEGAVRAWADTGLSAWLALAEVMLTLLFFTVSVLYARATAPSRLAIATTAASDRIPPT
ncbi:DUF2069 domain-containing protein [Pseudomethylobacillus aquaticus]|uniref:DUF2069 domain-containing protein n=1 Tax=Pseudomethylobacillus aquaticus TaxID=2676064 RepID=A0A3N0V6W2_9PROT|nr:DUF2069 domain-containing protein [Pseudomethylobacillus aquaticus]ROH88354.1 DUF2069 domain-containing protein [Pseudomethylobacillus aquaticus]